MGCRTRLFRGAEGRVFDLRMMKINGGSAGALALPLINRQNPSSLWLYFKKRNLSAVEFGVGFWPVPGNRNDNPNQKMTMHKPLQQIREKMPSLRASIVALTGCLACFTSGTSVADEYSWPEYSPTLAYDYRDEFGPLEPPTKILPGVSGVEGIYADDWWCFVWGTNAYPLVTEEAWIPMIERFNTDFAYISDVMGWPRDKRAQQGYYSTCYLLGSGLSTDAMTWEDGGGWMGATGYDGQAWPCIIATHYPVVAFDPEYAQGYQTGAMVHEGIHAILADMPGVKKSAWFHEGGNTWLQATMEAQRAGNFSGMGWLSRGSAIAPFMPIECYTGWLQDGSFGGPSAEGVYQGDGICTWRGLLGGVQYSEAFPHAIEVMLGAKSVAWVWRNAQYSGRVLQDMAEAPGGLGEVQMRRLIEEYRGRQAFADFKQWSHAYRQLLHGSWNAYIGPEYKPHWIECDPWYATCYAATTNNAGMLAPEARTLPGWSGANQIPLTVDPSATSASVSFNPIGENMSCQLVYRDTDGVIHYSDPVNSGTCTISLGDVLNDVIVAVVCNTDYIYEGEETRKAKFDYRLTMASGITGTADLYTKWWDYNPDTYTVTASAAANGSISPAGAVEVDNGAVQTFVFSPEPGYAVDDVILNGFPIGHMNSYTFNPVLGDYSLEVTFRDIVPPSAPTGLSATALDGRVTLDWVDNSESDMESYDVYRSTTSGSDYVLVASGVTSSDYADLSVVNGTTYYYAVTAVDVESNASGLSGEASVAAIDTLAPAQPTSLSADGTGTATVIHWSENSEPDWAGYTVYRSTTSGRSYVEIASDVVGNSYVDTAIENGTTYYYIVTASDQSSNESIESDEVTPTPVLLAHWDFNDPSLGAADGAAVPDSDGYWTWRTAAIDKTGNGNHLTTWDYSAAGFKWSNLSEDGDFSIKAAGDYPAAYTWSAKSTPSGTDAELFAGSSFTVEALATISGNGYTRTILCRDAQNLASTDSALAALYLGLDGGNHARFMYVDVNGQSTELLSSTSYAGDDNVFHHFSATSDGSTVALYVDGALVAQSVDQNMAGLGVGPTSGSGFHAGGWAVARGLYNANHVDRWYGYIDSISITATALEPGAFVLSDMVSLDPAPSAPEGLTATAGDGQIALDWDDCTDADLNYYTVYRSTLPGIGYVPIRVGLTNSVYTDPAADNGTPYYYVVTATDQNSSESEYSAGAFATPLDETPPAAPTGLDVSVKNGSVTLQWDDNADPDLSGYTVYRSTTSGGLYVAIAAELTVSAFVDNTVANGISYYYIVTASDTSALESSGSSEVSAISILSEVADGTIIGSAGSWGGSGNTIDMVFDGNFGTFFDAVNASGDWVGMDLGTPQTITKITYCPRSGFAGRMVGGRFEGTQNASFTSGVVTLYTISAQPAEGALTEQSISDSGTYRYVRYVGPAGGYCNVSEVEFHIAVETTPPISEQEYYIAGYELVGGTNLTLSVANSVPGHFYQVWETDTLTQPNWIPASEELEGLSASLEIQVPVDSDQESMFYKLQVQNQ